MLDWLRLRSRKPHRFESACLSNSGGREKNQDDIAVSESRTVSCWVVADGLGGHHGGEYASDAAVRNVIEAIGVLEEFDEQSLEQLVHNAHNAVLEAQERLELPSPRTTLSLVISDHERAWLVHVGDTRAYHFREGRVSLRTIDHSVPQMLASMGEIEEEEIRTHVDRSRLLQALGQEEPVRPAVSEAIELQQGDAFLLCTDGFWECVLDSEMETFLTEAPSPSEWLTRMEERVIATAEEGHDNYTALGVFVG